MGAIAGTGSKAEGTSEGWEGPHCLKQRLLPCCLADRPPESQPASSTGRHGCSAGHTEPQTAAPSLEWEEAGCGGGDRGVPGPSPKTVRPFL